MPRSVLVGSYGEYIFSIRRNCPTFPEWLYHLTVSCTAVYETCSFSALLSARVIVKIFYFGYSNRCVVVVMVLICICNG